MDVDAVLAYVKAELNETGNFHDGTLRSYIQDAADYLMDAGVPKSVMSSRAVYGCISRGVMDLWNYGAGDGKFSQYFKERAIQLSLR